MVLDVQSTIIGFGIIAFLGYLIGKNTKAFQTKTLGYVTALTQAILILAVLWQENNGVNLDSIIQINAYLILTFITLYSLTTIFLFVLEMSPVADDKKWGKERGGW